MSGNGRVQNPSAYLANQLGFSETGRFVLDNLIKPKIRRMGIIILDPFEECAKELDVGKIIAYCESEEAKYAGARKLWRDFSSEVTGVNSALMKRADCLLAILDGGHAVDDGVSSELGHYCLLKRGPIIALRSDFRGGENMGVSINPQVWGYINQSGGVLCEVPDALGKWFRKIKIWRDEYRKAA